MEYKCSSTNPSKFNNPSIVAEHEQLFRRIYHASREGKRKRTKELRCYQLWVELFQHLNTSTGQHARIRLHQTRTHGSFTSFHLGRTSFSEVCPAEDPVRGSNSQSFFLRLFCSPAIFPFYFAPRSLILLYVSYPGNLDFVETGIAPEPLEHEFRATATRVYDCG